VTARKDSGFTLFELLVVLLIIGGILTLAPAAFHRVMPGLELKSSVRGIATAMRDARSLAIRDNRETTVIVDTEAVAYRLGAGGRVQALDEDLQLSLVTAASERIDETAGRVRFFPDGTSTGGRVTLARGETEYYVLVDWLTGRVEISQ
jgi:general secretion pathway protein H